MTRWLLLRGLAREAAHWGSLPRLLVQRAGGRALALDLPGSGSEHRRRTPASVADIAADCAERWSPAPGARTVCIAMSLGAMVALDWLRQRPDAFDALVLVNTSAGGANPFWQRLQPRQYATLLSLARPGVPPLTRERRVLAMTSADPGRHPGLPGRWAEVARQRPVSPSNAVRQLWAAARYRIPFAPPAVPVLLLASEGDRLVSCACSMRLAQAWNAPLRLHPWAGHDLPLDDPAWVVAQVADWAAGLRG